MSVVPEPSSAILLACMLTATGLVRDRAVQAHSRDRSRRIRYERGTVTARGKSPTARIVLRSMYRVAAYEKVHGSP